MIPKSIKIDWDGELRKIWKVTDYNTFIEKITKNPELDPQKYNFWYFGENNLEIQIKNNNDLQMWFVKNNAETIKLSRMNKNEELKNARKFILL